MKSFSAIWLMAGLFLCHLVTAQTNEVNELTNTYYNIKNALVADDEHAVRINAESFNKQISLFPKNLLSETQEKSWNRQKNKLLMTSNAISKTNDIGKQREQLNELSNALFVLLKEFRMNEHAVYYQYCPMKKAYWLSNEKDIKNPYYGKKMLTCGSVKETLK